MNKIIIGFDYWILNAIYHHTPQIARNTINGAVMDAVNVYQYSMNPVLMVSHHQIYPEAIDTQYGGKSSPKTFFAYLIARSTWSA